MPVLALKLLWLSRIENRTEENLTMNLNNRTRMLSALMVLALATITVLGQTVTNVVPGPSAMQPYGDPNDTVRNFGLWWNGNGVVNQDVDFTMQSSANIPASLHVVYDCPGASVTGG